MIQLGGKQVVKSVCCVLQGEAWWFSWATRSTCVTTRFTQTTRMASWSTRQPTCCSRETASPTTTGQGSPRHQGARSVRGHHVTRGQGQSGVTTSPGGKVSQVVTMSPGGKVSQGVTTSPGGKVSQGVTMSPGGKVSQGVTTSPGGKVSHVVTRGQGQSGGHHVTRGQGQGCRTEKYIFLLYYFLIIYFNDILDTFILMDILAYILMREDLNRSLT